MKEFYLNMYPEESGGSLPPDEPDEGSVENVSDDLLAQNDEILRDAGHIPADPVIPRSEIMKRIRFEVGRKREKSLESTAEERAEIRDFLVTVNIEGADSLTDQELELIWADLLRNPALVKDFVYFLTTKNTANNYSEYPIMPDAKDLLEWSGDLANPESLRPRIIRRGADNLAGIGFDRSRVMEIEMGSHGPEQAEQMQMLGWIAGFLFMREARQELIEYHSQISLDPITVESLGRAFFQKVAKSLDVIREREKSYLTRFKMDRESLDFSHSQVRKGLEGVLALLEKNFFPGM